MLIGERTVLREPRADDLAMLTALRNDLEVQRMLLSRGRPGTEDRTQEWIDRVAGAPDAVFFVVASPDATPLGFVQLTSIDTISGHARLGIALDGSSRGRGHGTDAIVLVAQYGRDVFGLRKLWLEVLANNERAVRVYRELGFRDVGVLHAHHRYGDELLDVSIMEWLIDR